MIYNIQFLLYNFRFDLKFIFCSIFLQFSVLSKAKAALHTLEHAADDITFEMKFLSVPPKYPADAKDPVGTSPVLPTRKNPVFRISTKQFDLIQKCRPYPNIMRNIEGSILRLGLDESVISKRLEPGQEEPMENIARSSQSAIPFMKPAVELHEMSTQTPALECRRCDMRARNMLNSGTQTRVTESYSVYSQTAETDFIQAKLRLKAWETNQKMKDMLVKQEFAKDIDFTFDDMKLSRSPERKAIAPPGYREVLEAKIKKQEKEKLHYPDAVYSDKYAASKYYGSSSSSRY